MPRHNLFGKLGYYAKKKQHIMFIDYVLFFTKNCIGVRRSISNDVSCNNSAPIYRSSPYRMDFSNT